MTFNQWMKRVNEDLEAICGLDSSHLPDKNYMSWYEDGMEPREAAIEVLEDEGLIVEEDEFGDDDGFL